MEYEFSDSGEWILASIYPHDVNVEWDLEGLWSFGIYTYYVDVAILEMDYKHGIAIIEERGSEFEGSGSPKQRGIEFAEENGVIYFDTFTAGENNRYSMEKEITLIARIDDMYYMHPGMFGEGSEYERPIGGRSQ